MARKRRHQKYTQNLERSFQRSFTRLQSGDLSAGHDIERFKTLLQQLDKGNIRGQHIRCTAVLMDEGETSSKFFSASEKRQSGSHHFQELYAPDGSLATSPGQLLSVVIKTYYSNFYQKEEICPSAVERLLSTVDLKLSDDDRAICEGQLKMNECCAPMQQSKSGKSPGMDGLPLESFPVGERFLSFVEQLRIYETSTYTKFWRRYSRPVAAVRKRLERPLSDQIKYYEITYSCIHGRRKFIARGDGKRCTS